VQDSRGRTFNPGRNGHGVRLTSFNELLPPDRGRRAEQFKRMVADLIDKQVSEALASNSDALFQPWFQLRKVAYEIKRKQTVTEQRKWTEYFKKYGCIVCSPNARTNYGHAIATDKEKIAELRKQGLSWEEIAKEFGVGHNTLYKFRARDRSRKDGGKRFERPEAPEIGNGLGHRSLSLCTDCYQRIASRAFCGIPPRIAIALS
jgi:hypothetical protein